HRIPAPACADDTPGACADTGPTDPKHPVRGLAPALAVLCAIARFHQIPADAAALAHHLGLASTDRVDADTLLHAARHLGLKARRSRTSADRLPLTPLPAIAMLRSEDGERFAILARCDGQRVLLHDPG